LIQTFKIINGIDKVDKLLFFEIDSGGRRGHSSKLFKRLRLEYGNPCATEASNQAREPVYRLVSWLGFRSKGFILGRGLAPSPE